MDGTETAKLLTLQGFYNRVIVKIKCDSFEDGPSIISKTYRNVRLVTQVTPGEHVLISMSNGVDLFNFRIASIEARR